MLSTRTSAGRRGLHGPARLALLALVTVAPACQLTEIVRPSDGGGDILSFPPADRPVPGDTPQVPLDDGADWVQLVSGEWLRGEVVRMRDGTLDFDSDELGLQSLDFGDLLAVQTAGEVVLVTTDERTVRGRLVVRGDDAWVEGEQTVRIPRDDIMAAIAANGDSPVEWTGAVNVGAVTRSGNTDQTDVSLYGRVVRETAQTRWTNTYTGAYSEARGARTANNHRIRSIYDIFLTSRLFLTLPSIDIYSDEFQNIDYRIIPSAQVGYELIDTADHSWRVAAGPAYQYTKYDTAAPGEDDTDSSFASVASSFYEWDITGDVTFGFDYQIAAPIPDTDEYNHNFVVRLDVDLIDDLTFNVAFIWDRVNKPVAQDDGSVPEKDDYRTTIGLGWAF